MGVRGNNFMNNNVNDKELLIEKLLEEADKVFFYCVKRCNSRNDAEDLSQDILLDILININKGIKIETLIITYGQSVKIIIVNTLTKK